MQRRDFLRLTSAALAASAGAISFGADQANEVVFDSASPGKEIRALHGVNGGPLAAGGLLDLSDRWKEAAFPLARLHDSHWPHPDVVDVQAIFPNFDADPARQESYDFERTDEYVKAVHRCGAGIVYRLGESIEHQTAKRRAHPPKDFAKWAAICAGIVRHYTAGWANGMELPIQYWEIWNEPDNRPNCWTGNDDDYLRLYAIAATALRKEFPDIKIGGPGLGNSGTLKDAQFEPTPFLRSFLHRCRHDKLPLDFLSWHCYTADPSELVQRASGVRGLLDESGFKQTESHLNEWNYLPDNSWPGISDRNAKARERWYARVNGAEGAAFAAAAMIALQDTPLAAANYFTAEAPGMGLFSQHGVPSRAFGAFLAIKELAGLKRLPSKSQAGYAVLAGLGDELRIVAANTNRSSCACKFTVHPAPWAGKSHYEILQLDDAQDLAPLHSGRADHCTVAIDLPAHSVCLIRLRSEAA